MSNEGIELRVYSATNPTEYLDTLVGRQKPKYLEETGEGAGSFEIHPTDPQLLETPGLLDFRNVVKVAVDNEVVGAFLVINDEAKTIQESEGAAEAREISGQGLLRWLDDATLKPSFNRFSRMSKKKRFFNFATEVKSWYKPADWTTPRVVGKWGDRPWGKTPEKWPADHRARWVWNGPYTGSGIKIKSPRAAVNLFRTEFQTDDDGGTYIFYLAGDDFLEAWVDGDQLVTTEYKESSWNQAIKVTVELPAGKHIFGARVTNSAQGPGAFMAALYHQTAEGKEEQTNFYTGGPAIWNGYYQPNPMPTWTAGEVMLKIINEAKARGVKSFSWMVPTFNETHDSRGVPWLPTEEVWEFDIGDSYLAIVEKICERGYQAWVDPITYTLNIAQSRGIDRTIEPNSVVFERGKNLRTAASKGVGKIKNSLDVSTSEGWMVGANTKDAASILKYGPLEAKYSADVPMSVAKQLMKPLFKQYATPEEGATYDIISGEEKPLISFGVDDMVLGPNKNEVLVPRRVVSISVEETDSGQPLYAIEFDTIFRSNEQRIGKILGNTTGGSIGSGMSNSTQTAPAVNDPYVPGMSQAPEIPPAAPTDLVVTSEGAWSANGVVPTSIVHFSWAPVLLDEQGDPTSVEYYEVYGRPVGGIDEEKLITGSTTNTVDAQPFTPGSVWDFRVVAMNFNGSARSEYSVKATHTMVGPSKPLPAPSTPTLTTDLGMLVVTWDGLMVTGQAPENHFRYIYAEVAVANSGIWKKMGSALQRNSRTMTIAGLTVGTNYFVRLVAVDGLGILSANSTAASIVLKGVDLGNLEDALADAEADVAAAQAAIDALELDFENMDITISELDGDIQAVKVTANGKNAITYSTRAPLASDAGVYDDTWFQFVSDRLIGQWRYTTSWVVQKIDNLLIATLDAAKINTGFLDAARIKADSITAGHIIIGDFTNAFSGSDFEDIGAIPWDMTNARMTRATDQFYAGSASLKVGPGSTSITSTLGTKINVNAGEEWLVTFWVKADAAYNGQGNNAKLRVGDQANNLRADFQYGADRVDTEEWTQIRALYKVPATGVTSLRLGLVFNHTLGNIWIDEMVMRRKAAGELIVDGAITSNLIKALAIITSHIQAGIIDATHIQVGSLVGELFQAESIGTRELKASSVEADHIKVGAIQVVHLSPSIGNDIDISANDTVTIIAGQAASAQSTAEGTQDDLASMQTYYEFGPEGAIISTPDSPFAVAIRNDSIDMLENGNVVSYWNSGTLYVNQLVGEKVILGNHQLEKYNTGTVVRAL